MGDYLARSYCAPCAEKKKGPLEGQHHQEALCGQSFAQTVQYSAEVVVRRWLAKGEGVVDRTVQAGAKWRLSPQSRRANEGIRETSKNRCVLSNGGAINDHTVHVLYDHRHVRFAGLSIFPKFFRQTSGVVDRSLVAGQ
jgi:hypothetical protein